jgi:S1-C subfamily serine protease
MTRLVALALVLALPLCTLAEEKAPPKPSYIGVMVAAGKEKGSILILSTVKDGPADKSGLKAGDVVLKIDGAKANDLDTAVKVIRALKPNRKAQFQVLRDGKEMVIDVTPRPAE